MKRVSTPPSIEEESGRDDLPEGWVQTTLSEICFINPPKPAKDALRPDARVTFVPMPAVDAELGAITNADMRPFSKVRKGYTAFRDGDVIMAKITPCMENGKAAIARNLENGLGFGSTEFHVLRPRAGALADFVYHFIRQESYRKAAESEMTGSVGQKRVTKHFMEATAIPLAPHKEQRRIIKTLTELIAKNRTTRDRLERVPKILKAFRQSVLTSACSGHLTEDWRSKQNIPVESIEKLLERIYRKRISEYERLCRAASATGQRNPSRPVNLRPKLHDPKDISFDVPESWFWSSLQDICEARQYAMSSGPFGSALGTKDYTDSGVPVIRGQNIQAGSFLLENFVYISEQKAAELDRSIARPGDIVVVAVGTSGQAAIVPRQLRLSVLSQNCNRWVFT